MVVPVEDLQQHAVRPEVGGVQVALVPDIAAALADAAGIPDGYVRRADSGVSGWDQLVADDIGGLNSAIDDRLANSIIDRTVVDGAPVTFVETHVWVLGRGNPNAQTLEIQHLDAAGVLQTPAIVTISVSAGFEGSMRPVAFSYSSLADGHIVQTVRTTGTGVRPLVKITLPNA